MGFTVTGPVVTPEQLGKALQAVGRFFTRPAVEAKVEAPAEVSKKPASTIEDRGDF